MKYIKLSALALAIFATVGCTKTDTDQIGNQTESQVSFVTEINGQAQVSSKATTPLPENTEVLISAGQYSGLAFTPYFILAKPYKVSGATLAPIARDPHTAVAMMLPKASYAFAAVAATNSATNIIPKGGEVYTKNLHYGVTSGVDYLGALSGKKEVTSSSSMTLVFDHLATQIELTLLKDDATVDALEVTQVQITPTQRLSSLLDSDLLGYLSITEDHSMKIDAANIEVDPSATLVPMTQNELVFSHIVLPSSRTGDLKMRITGTITLAGQSAPIAKVYEVAVPISAASPLVAGKRHSYTATIGASGITFNGTVNLGDWLPGNGEQGTDLGEI